VVILGLISAMVLDSSSLIQAITMIVLGQLLDSSCHAPVCCASSDAD
jgi:hypothetical protein